MHQLAALAAESLECELHVPDRRNLQQRASFIECCDAGPCATMVSPLECLTESLLDEVDRVLRFHRGRTHLLPEDVEERFNALVCFLRLFAKSPAKCRVASEPADELWHYSLILTPRYADMWRGILYTISQRLAYFLLAIWKQGRN
jgi:hypothetical protein